MLIFNLESPVDLTSSSLANAFKNIGSSYHILQEARRL